MALAERLTAISQGPKKFDFQGPTPFQLALLMELPASKPLRTVLHRPLCEDSDKIHDLLSPIEIWVDDIPPILSLPLFSVHKYRQDVNVEHQSYNTCNEGFFMSLFGLPCAILSSRQTQNSGAVCTDKLNNEMEKFSGTGTTYWEYG
jgi:hypothetical protein